MRFVPCRDLACLAVRRGEDSPRCIVPPSSSSRPAGTLAARRNRLVLAAATTFLAAFLFPPAPRAQSVEPRLYSNAPVGMNFLLVGYTNSSGGAVLDPSIPLEDASLRVHAPFVGYARALDVAHLSGQIQVVVPYAWLSGKAVLTSTGEVRNREVNGLGDPAVRFGVNVHGAPALPPAEFNGYDQDLIVGVSLYVSPPLGRYDPDRLVNLGTNRWTFRPEFGFSKKIHRWYLEASAAVNFYTDNDDFYGGQRRSQEPIYAAQAHAIYVWRRGLWLAADATYYTGGRTTIDGVKSDDLQSNWRFGATLALPINRHNSAKVYYSNGVSTRSGEDFLTLGAAWQHHWGKGM